MSQAWTFITIPAFSTHFFFFPSTQIYHKVNGNNTKPLTYHILHVTIQDRLFSLLSVYIAPHLISSIKLICEVILHNPCQSSNNKILSEHGMIREKGPTNSPNIFFRHSMAFSYEMHGTIIGQNQGIAQYKHYLLQLRYLRRYYKYSHVANIGYFMHKLLYMGRNRHSIPHGRTNI